MHASEPFRTLAAFAPDPASTAFAPLLRQPAIHATGFALQDALRVTFDASKGGRMRLAAVVPPVGAPHYRLTPLDLGSADWCAVELELPPQALPGLDTLIPCLDAASLRKLSLFAVLRVVAADGRSHDGSSTMVELGPDRRRAVFPVSLGDIPATALNGAQSARVIFFLEARQVDLDLYGLTVAGVPTPPPVMADDALRGLRGKQTGRPAPVPPRILSAASRKGWMGKVAEFAEIATGVFLNIEPGPGRKVTVSRGWSALDIDFHAAATAGWRSIEFRFPPFADSGRMAAALTVAAQVQQSRPVPVNVILRQYAGKGAPFRDAVLGAGLFLHSDATARETRFELSPYLSDSTATHDIGLMLFLPPDTGLLTVHRIEAALADLSGT